MQPQSHTVAGLACLSKRERERDLRIRVRRPGCARSSWRASARAVSGRSLPGYGEGNTKGSA
eukprot:scaffold97188_cov57-Phaeocystis_antarctica.AAC.2